MKVKRESKVAQSCLTLSDPMDYSLPGSSVHGIFQARVLERDVIAFSSPTANQQKKTITSSYPPPAALGAGAGLAFEKKVDG